MKNDLPMRGLDKEIQEIIERAQEKWRANRASPSEATKQLELHLEKAPQESVQQCLAFIPTPMARISPFFPMSDREKAHRPQEVISVGTSWGKMEVSGPKLSIFDEDVLLAALALLMGTRRPEKTQMPGGWPTYTLRTSLYTLCKYLNLKPGKRTYKYIEGAIKRLTGTVTTLEVKDSGKGENPAPDPAVDETSRNYLESLKDKNPGENAELHKAREWVTDGIWEVWRGKTRFTMWGTILSGGFRDKATGEVIITLNPYFYEVFGERMLTYLDLTLRRRLTGDISKALLRFYESHRGSPEMHILTIADAINLRDLPPFRLKARLNKGLKELVRVSHLKRGWIDKKGIVRIKKDKPLKIKPRGT